jgi:hypothetical protein
VLNTNPNNSGNMYAGVYLDNLPGCPLGLAMLHEVTHTLGGVQESAPRHNDQNGGHSRDEYDRMSEGANLYVSDTCPRDPNEKRLDCNKNDYFDPSPSATEYLATHWNTANNKFLVGE